ncbi:MAG: MlaC/ttg2D family ABC transporter substrate-binding protein [Rhodoferax sp.]
MKRRLFGHLFAALLVSSLAWLTVPASAADEAPDALIQRLTTEALNSIKADKAVQSGDFDRVIALVDTLVMPNVDFKRMTASAVGPKWRQATPEQQQRLQEEFKILLVRTYAGALSQVNEVKFRVLPMRSSPNDKEVVVRTQVIGRGDPIQLDYRLEKTPGQGAGWQIHNLNVMGVWLVDTYRSQFAQEINTKGIDGLISTLAERNQANAKKG